MINQDVTAGLQAAFQLSWRLGMAGVEVKDLRKAKSGCIRFLVDQDPRGPLRLPFQAPEIQEDKVIGIEHAGCELVWLKN